MKARSATSSAPICKHGSFSDASRSLARTSPDPASGLSVSSSYENLSSPNNLHLPAAYPAPPMRKHLQDVPVHSRTNYILALSCTNTAHEHIFFGIFHRLSTSQAPPAFTSATTTQSTASTALRPALLSRRALGCGSHASSRASLLFLFIC